MRREDNLGTYLPRLQLLRLVGVYAGSPEGENHGIGDQSAT